MQRLLRNESAILCWMLKIKTEHNVSLPTMYGRLNLAPLESKLRLNHLRWYGYVERSDKWTEICTNLEIDGFMDRVGPRKIWSATVTEDLKAWNIDVNKAYGRPVWKKALRTAMKSLTDGNGGSKWISK